MIKKYVTEWQEDRIFAAEQGFEAGAGQCVLAGFFGRSPGRRFGQDSFRPSNDLAGFGIGLRD